MRGIVFVGKKKNERGTGRHVMARDRFSDRRRSVPPRIHASYRPRGNESAREKERDIYGEADAQTRHAHEFGRADGPRERKGEGELLTFHGTDHARVTDSIQHDAFSSRVAAVLRASRYSALDSCAV